MTMTSVDDVLVNFFSVSPRYPLLGSRYRPSSSSTHSSSPKRTGEHRAPKRRAPQLPAPRLPQTSSQAQALVPKLRVPVLVLRLSRREVVVRVSEDFKGFGSR